MSDERSRRDGEQTDGNTVGRVEVTFQQRNTTDAEYGFFGRYVAFDADGEGDERRATVEREFTVPSVEPGAGTATVTVEERHLDPTAGSDATVTDERTDRFEVDLPEETAAVEGRLESACRSWHEEHEPF